MVACEESQRVCTAFRKRGHEAYSCDILEPSGGHPEWHILGDCLKILSGGVFVTMDGTEHSIEKWDLLIAHPPCTYLSNVSTRAFSLRCSPPDAVVGRWEERAKAAIFFMRFALADIPKVCVENPVGFMNNNYRKPSQIIDPYMFSSGKDDLENFVTKRTCLWLKGLNPLVPTYTGNKPDNRYLFGVYANGKAKCWEDTYTRKSGVRSKTFSGIAKAMAEQWG